MWLTFYHKKTFFEEKMMTEKQQLLYKCVLLVNMLRNSLRCLINSREIKNNENTADSRKIKNNENTADSREIKNNENTADSRKIKNNENTIDFRKIKNTADSRKIKNNKNNKNTTDSRKIKNHKNTTNSREIKDNENTTDSRNTKDYENTTESTEMQYNHNAPCNANNADDMDHRLTLKNRKVRHWKPGNQMKWLIYLSCLCKLTTECTGTVNTNDEAAVRRNLTLTWRMPMNDIFDAVIFYQNQRNMGTYTRQAERIRATMFYTDRLEFKVEPVEGGQRQVVLTISNPSATDLIADYTANFIDENGKETSQIKPYFIVNLEPDKEYVISSEGNVANFVWIYNNNNKPDTIIISRRDQHGGRQLVVEWTEEYGINSETRLLSVVKLTSTPSIYGMNNRITLSMLTGSSRDFDYTYYAQVFKSGGMSDKSLITLIHEECMCPSGEFVSKPCTDLKPAQCQSCAIGTFNSNRDVSMSCQECLPECGAEAHAQHKCNSSHDLVCECKSGFEKRDFGLQTACFRISETTTSKLPPIYSDVETTTSKLPPIYSDVKTTTSKLPPIYSDVATTNIVPLSVIISVIIVLMVLGLIVFRCKWCRMKVSNILKRHSRKEIIPEKKSDVMDTLLLTDRHNDLRCIEEGFKPANKLLQ